jgi:hypothetical protein
MGEVIMYNKKSKIITWIIIFAMIFSQGTLLNYIPVEAVVNANLLITGTGLNHEVNIASSDWSNYELTERIYSTNNSLNFHKIIKAKGYDLFELIGVDNLKNDKDYEIKFTCSDGAEFKKTVNELKNTYYYSDFTENIKIKSYPLIATYTVVLADFPKDSFDPPIKWEDKDITENDIDNDLPKLVFGQTSIDDMNMSQWGKRIISITVGDEITNVNTDENSTYKHIAYDGAPYNIDAITSATLTIEGPGVEGYRAISMRQIEEETVGQEESIYNEKIDDKVVQNSYEGINVGYLINNFVHAKDNAGNIIFKDKSRKTIFSCSIEDAQNYMVAYGVNEVPLVYLDTDVGYRDEKYNDGGCFKLVSEQDINSAKEFSNVAYIYIEEKDAKNIYEHSYSPYNDSKYTDYELIVHGDGIGKEVRYKVSDIEAMKKLQVSKEYSLSNSEYFWYYNTYKGIPLWDLLVTAGMNPEIDENTKIQIIAADNYNFPPMTIKEIKDDSLYGYYEKSALDKGDGEFNGKDVEPLYSGAPVLVAYGFNGYPYVTRPTDAGYNAGIANDGGPLRIIFGKTSYQHTNGSNQVQFAKEIIVGEGESLNNSTDGIDTSIDGEKTQTKVDENSNWKHNQGMYETYKDIPVLRVTGSQLKEPMTFTLGQIESMNEYAIRDVYTGDGVHEFEGINLWDIISEVVGLEDGADTPSIRVFSGANYNQILKSNEQVVNGVNNSQGKVKDIILAYAVDGYPLVPNEGDIGYANNNAYGPLRLIIEENKSMWVKWADCIVVGTGDYEVPDIKDVKEVDFAKPENSKDVVDNKTWITFKNDTGKELLEASVRSMEYDSTGNLWVGTNNGGVSVRSPKGEWSYYKEIVTENNETVKIDTSYAIVQRENGELWMALGGAETPKGILIKKDNKWNLVNTTNSKLPSDFVQEIELDGNGGLWLGTGLGAVHIDKSENWTIYDKSTGLSLNSIDAIEIDGKGGVWLGFCVEAEGEGTDMVCNGAYQYIDVDNKITTYTDFENKSYGANWVRSISMDTKGGVWVTRSGNYTGQGHAEIDYVLDGVRTVYTAEELYPGISTDDDIRFVYVSKNGKLYIATRLSGVLVCEDVGEISEKINSSTVFPNKKWDNIYYLNEDDENIVVGSNGGLAILTNAKTFGDIQNHWAKDDIEKMSTMGYVNGSDDEFRPNENITRAEFASLVVRILGLETDITYNDTFSDVKSTDWYANNISIAVENNIVKGYENGTFNPNGYIMREEIASIISNEIGKKLTSDEIKEVISNYTDNVSAWAQSSVASATKAEIIKGLPNDVFGGTDKATRAQAVVMLLRFLEY